MAALKLITAAALLAMLAFPAYADVTGPACVTDGDTLVVNGKRQRTRCAGGPSKGTALVSGVCAVFIGLGRRAL